MSLSSRTVSRRQVVAGGATLAAIATLAPQFATAGAPAGEAAAAPSPIAALWARAQSLKAEMAPHAGPIAAAFANGGTPGWMRLPGAINALGHERYETLVAILKASPASLEDVAIVAAATRDPEMVHGPRSWAHAQFDRASREYHLAA